MDHIQIELLFCQYGWPISRIADVTGLPQTYITKVVEENKWSKGVAVTNGDVQVIDGEDAQATAIKDLQGKEVAKQASLAPLVAVTEIALLSKLAETINYIEPDGEDAHIKIQNLVRAFKSLQQDSVVNKIIEETNTNPGIAVQVVTHIT